jgi:hypothetical protein
MEQWFQCLYPVEWFLMRRPIPRLRWTGLLLALSATMNTSASVQSPPAVPAPLPALHRLFDPSGPVLRDRNGDGVTDGVDAHIVLGDTPTTADVAAAANVAARFGFESAELNLPLPVDGGRVAVVVGTSGLKKAGLDRAAFGLDALTPGEGLVTVAGSSDRPLLIVAGRDDAGTKAAGEFVAARLPYAWDVKGVTLGQVQADLAAALTAAQVCRQSGEVAVVVRAGGDAIERLIVQVRCDTAAHAVRLEAALRAQQRAAPSPMPAVTSAVPSVAAPAATPPAAPATAVVTSAATPAATPRSAPRADTATDRPSPAHALDYPGILTIRFDVHTPGARIRLFDLPRLTIPPPLPLARRSSSAKDNLDLSTLYDNDGLLGDSDSNLIPDRTDILLVPDGPSSISPRVSPSSRPVCHCPWWSHRRRLRHPPRNRRSCSSGRSIL